MMGRQSVVVHYDPDDHAVVVVDTRGRPLQRLRVAANRPIKVAEGAFRWAGRPIEPDEDDYGLAVAFAHFVTTRTEPSVAEQMFGEPIPVAVRWQYAVVNIGMFNTADRMTQVLATAGAGGWELVHVYDKASNWMGQMEKGFMLLKRPVPDGYEPKEWCVNFRNV